MKNHDLMNIAILSFVVLFICFFSLSLHAYEFTAHDVLYDLNPTESYESGDLNDAGDITLSSPIDFTDGGSPHYQKLLKNGVLLPIPIPLYPIYWAGKITNRGPSTGNVNFTTSSAQPGVPNSIVYNEDGTTHTNFAPCNGMVLHNGYIVCRTVAPDSNWHALFLKPDGSLEVDLHALVLSKEPTTTSTGIVSASGPSLSNGDTVIIVQGNNSVHFVSYYLYQRSKPNQLRLIRPPSGTAFDPNLGWYKFYMGGVVLTTSGEIFATGLFYPANDPIHYRAMLYDIGGRKTYVLGTVPGLDQFSGGYVSKVGNRIFVGGSGQNFENPDSYNSYKPVRWRLQYDATLGRYVEQPAALLYDVTQPVSGVTNQAFFQYHGWRSGINAQGCAIVDTGRQVPGNYLAFRTLLLCLTGE